MAASSEEKRLGKGGDKSFKVERRVSAGGADEYDGMEMLGTSAGDGTDEVNRRGHRGRIAGPYTKKERWPLLSPVKLSIFGPCYS